MEAFYTTIALITAGVSLFAGLVNLFIGFHKEGEKVDVLFGSMCLAMFIFFMIPPAGFILHDQAPYGLQIDIKRIFNNSFNLLFPWFVFLYTGRKKKLMPCIISLTVVVAYVLMVLTRTDTQKPLWTWAVVFALTLNVCYGYYSGFAQLRLDEKSKAKWFITAMHFFALFYLLTVINQLTQNYFGNILGTKLFFPINLFPVSFIVIIGIRLRADALEKYKLEKILRSQDIRWDWLVQNMQLLIVEVDSGGIIKYLNPYAVKTLGYVGQDELLGRSWFDTAIPKDEAADRKAKFIDVIKEGKLMPHLMNDVVTKNGSRLIINWTNIFVYNDNIQITGAMSIGVNITEQEKAFQEIRTLKIELEKESLNENRNLPVAQEPNIIGESEAIMYAIQKANQVAPTNATVLLEGETGVGKELFANLIHERSYRNEKPFIKLNCAALPPELIESELFGHEKGSFTGATQARKGRFELADGGTIFLDEISELPVSLQPKLLRVLQSGEFERLGAQQTFKVDVRVISATNRDLLKEVGESRFREDLYYRLNVFPITVPPLRNRQEDIPLLVAHFVRLFSEQQAKNVQNISKADMMRFKQYSWPGNVRELMNVIERSMISTTGSTLKLEWLNQSVPPEPTIYFSMEEVERAHILKILRESKWKINGDDGAANKLGLHPNTLRSRLKRLNITRAEP